ncbi:hypothetical protein JKP88DRAFT_268550 [Tribonema minus]|uniref:Uncharacterized protein n=1 Tax=Tribonema minus TaxID=303371 RepID=A0A836CGM2_9STRA|nr:hypothetical protein JKP88DRAFT_268550 [Tribonema minus]
MPALRTLVFALLAAAVASVNACTFSVQTATGDVCVDPCTTYSQVVWDRKGTPMCLTYTSGGTTKLCPSSNIAFLRDGTPLCVLTPNKSGLCPVSNIKYLAVAMSGMPAGYPLCIMTTDGSALCPTSKIAYKSNGNPYCKT